MTTNMLTIALPTGRLGEIAIELFKTIQLYEEKEDQKRKLILINDTKKIKYLYVKPSDVITYVENGIADLGVIGKDSILEEQKDVYELMDLGFGKCRFSIAGYKDQNYLNKEHVLKVATKYPNVASNYFNKINQPFEIIKLNGSVELAPLVGLSDVIVDIVETGSTLKANGLIVLKDIVDISTKLIANRASYRIKHKQIQEIMELIQTKEEDASC